MKIVAMTAEQAREFPAFILPGVTEQPESRDFWYLAAVEEERGILGMLVVDPQLGGAAIESVMVAQDSVRQGVATELILYAVERLSEQNVPFLIADETLTPEQWGPVDALLTGLGFYEDEDGRAGLFRISLDEVQQLPLYVRYAAQKHSQITTVEAMSAAQRHELSVFLRTSAGLAYGGLADCDAACSCVWKEEGKIQGIFLLTPPENGSMFNLWAWLDARAENPGVLISVITAALREAVAKYPGDTAVYFTGLSASSRRLIDRILADHQTTLEERAYRSYLPERGAVTTIDFDALLADAEKQAARRLQEQTEGGAE